MFQQKLPIDSILPLTSILSELRLIPNSWLKNNQLSSFDINNDSSTIFSSKLPNTPNNHNEVAQIIKKNVTRENATVS